MGFVHWCSFSSSLSGSNKPLRLEQTHDEVLNVNNYKGNCLHGNGGKWDEQQCMLYLLPKHNMPKFWILIQLNVKTLQCGYKVFIFIRSSGCFCHRSFCRGWIVKLSQRPHLYAWFPHIVSSQKILNVSAAIDLEEVGGEAWDARGPLVDS